MEAVKSDQSEDREHPHTLNVRRGKTKKGENIGDLKGFDVTKQIKRDAIHKDTEDCRREK